jgi:uncharacterized protein YndB with AHSA1/START domain
MKTQTIGTLRREGERRGVRHERRYDAPPEEVWAALTEPEQVRNWLAEMTIEPRRGGRITFAWDSGPTDHGVVRVFDPPKIFEYTWEKGEREPSLIRFELVADGDGTILTLDHSKIGVDSAASIGAGWHMHLDAMEALLKGSPQTPAEWNSRYEGLVGLYEEQAKAL